MTVQLAQCIARRSSIVFQVHIASCLESCRPGAVLLMADGLQRSGVNPGLWSFEAIARPSSASHLTKTVQGTRDKKIIKICRCSLRADVPVHLFFLGTEIPAGGRHHLAAGKF